MLDVELHIAHEKLAALRKLSGVSVQEVMIEDVGKVVAEQAAARTGNQHLANAN